MEMKCVCVVEQLRDQQSPHGPPKHCEDPRAMQRAPGLKDIDLCEIVKRSQDENRKHNDFDCHYKGEKRQNLINKIKMYLDDYDDRPVMKGKGKGGDESKALGQTGFGPMIKYPGYVDYDHPYFSDPYNKMPTLATTVGQRGENPCVPIQVRDWDECHPQSKGHKAAPGGHTGQGASRDVDDYRCHCAERSEEVPRCPAAGSTSSAPGGHGATPANPRATHVMPPRELAMTPQTPPAGSYKYICIPLPDDC